MDASELKALIRERGLTYEKIGAEIGVTTQAICEVVQGRSKGAAMRYAVARVLGVDVADIWPADEAGVAA